MLINGLNASFLLYTLYPTLFNLVANTKPFQYFGEINLFVTNDEHWNLNGFRFQIKGNSTETDWKLDATKYLMSFCHVAVDRIYICACFIL